MGAGGEIGTGGDIGTGGETVWGREWLAGEKPSPHKESSEVSIRPSTITNEAVGSIPEDVTWSIKSY